MSVNYRGDGDTIDLPFTIQTGITITAGSLVWVDGSGTGVVHPIRSYSGVTPESNATFPQSGTGRGILSVDTIGGANIGASGVFLGVLARTQTGSTVNGEATGVTIHRRGVFEFLTTPTSSCRITLGMPVYATKWDTVIGAGSGVAGDPTGTNLTGNVPIGIAVAFPAAVHATNVATRVHVLLTPNIMTARLN